MAAHAIDPRVSPRALVVRLATPLCAAALALTYSTAAGQARHNRPVPVQTPTVIERADPDFKPIDPVHPGEEWSELFAALSGKQPLFATFTETRRYPFRKEPVQLEGEMRFAREHGLSLHYAEPESRTLVVDEDGVLMRDSRGRSHSVPADRGGAPAPAALLPILGFELEQIAESFEIRGARSGDEWWLEFAPLENNDALKLGPIQVTGENEAVTHIAFRHESGQQVEIAIERTKTQVTFSIEELGLWFR